MQNPYTPFAPYLRPYRRAVAAGLALLAVSLAITTVLPLLLKQAIDVAGGALDPGEGGAPSPVTGSVSGDITLCAWIIAALAVVGWLVNFGMRWYFTSMSRYVERDLRRAYVHHLLRLPLRFFHQRRAGDLMARATNDVEAVQRFLHHAFRMTLTGVFTFVLSLALMCYIDWQLALLSLAPMPVMAAATSWVSGRVRTGFRLVQEQFAAMSARIQESLSGVRVVKACAIESREVADFARLNDDYVERNRDLVVVRSLFFPFAFLVIGVSMVVVLWLGGLRVMEGTLTLGSFVAFNAYLIRMGRPMMLLGRMVDEFQRASASMTRIAAILAEAPEDRGAGQALPLRGEVELRDVRFAFDGADPVLDGIDLRVPAGSTLAIVGRVGSGKSTLARLIPRLLEAGQGEVLIDGVPVRQLPLADLRGAIGYVPQDSFLFSDTIRENIALGLDGLDADGKSEVTERRRDGAAGDGRASRRLAARNGEPVAWAAEVSQLAVDVADFPAGYETVVGERGITLSGGQKQRAALARAVIRQPRILILDDALSSVDTHTEEEILRRLRGVLSSCTAILIAHRLSTVRDADCIVVLDGGRIAEQGTHEQLVTRGGLYADMHRRQSLARELTSL